MYAFKIETRQSKIYYSFYELDDKDCYETEDGSDRLQVRHNSGFMYFEQGCFSSEKAVVIRMLKHYLEENKKRIEMYSNLLEAEMCGVTLKNKYQKPELPRL